MAVFQLGALVTEIVGSIGGTTFKRQGTSRVMMRKSNGASRSRVLQNPRLGLNATIFQKWRNLSGAVQTAWANIAAANTVKNKFGENVHISGTNFQRKMDLQVNFLGETPDPLNWSPDIDEVYFIPSPILNYTNNTFSVEFGSATAITANIALMLEFSLQPLNAPTFVSRGVFFNGPFDMLDVENVYSAFVSYFNLEEAQYNMRMYAYVYTPSGITGTMIQSDVTVII